MTSGTDFAVDLKAAAEGATVKGGKVSPVTPGIRGGMGQVVGKEGYRGDGEDESSARGGEGTRAELWEVSEREAYR